MKLTVMLTAEKETEKSTYIHSNAEKEWDVHSSKYAYAHSFSSFSFSFPFFSVFVSLPLYLSCSVGLIRQGESTKKKRTGK